MKKSIKKLRLHRETLRSLTDRSLEKAAGGVSDAGTLCASDCGTCTDTCTQCSKTCKIS